MIFYSEKKQGRFILEDLSQNPYIIKLYSVIQVKTPW